MAHGSTDRLLSRLCLEKQAIINTVAGKKRHKKRGQKIKDDGKNGAGKGKAEAKDAEKGNAEEAALTAKEQHRVIK